MYGAQENLDLKNFYQGDVVQDFPFFIFEDSTFPEPSSIEVETKLDIKTKLSKVIILSQTCDIDYRQNIIICPVYKISEFTFNNEELDSIKKRKTGYWFYLPNLNGVLEESIGDFQTIYYVPRNFLNKYKNKKLLSLSDWGRHHLGWALANYFGRPIENKD